MIFSNNKIVFLMMFMVGWIGCFSNAFTNVGVSTTSTTSTSMIGKVGGRSNHNINVNHNIHNNNHDHRRNVLVLNGIFDKVGEFFDELDAFVDDATSRRLGAGSNFYGKRKSNFYGDADQGKKKNRQVADPTG